MHKPGNYAGHFARVILLKSSINLIFLDLLPYGRIQPNHQKGKIGCRIFQGNLSGLQVLAAVSALDISNSDQVADAARNIQASMGKINVLINCAGMNSPKRHWRDLDIADWHRIVAVNLNGVANTVCATLPVMRAQKDGLIINISSWSARHEFPAAGPAYIASKRGVIDLSHSINQEEMHNNIRCCCISPGEVATPILKQRPVPVTDEELSLMLKPDDLAEMVSYVVAAPMRVCFNEIVMSPTYNRTLLPQP